jgi:hypothetical protein
MFEVAARTIRCKLNELENPAQRLLGQFGSPLRTKDQCEAVLAAKTSKPMKKEINTTNEKGHDDTNTKQLPSEKR